MMTKMQLRIDRGIGSSQDGSLVAIHLRSKTHKRMLDCPVAHPVGRKAFARPTFDLDDVAKIVILFDCLFPVCIVVSGSGFEGQDVLAADL